MSTRWMAVQYVGNVLRLPVASEEDMDKPFRYSALERDVRRIVVNPFSDNPKVFMPESEIAKLRELVRDMYAVMVTDAANCDVTYPEQFDDRMRELGVEVDW